MSDDYEVAYICDRKACGDRCPSLLAKHDYCTHTTDISHAVNFALIGREPKYKYAEINDEVKAFLEDATHNKHLRNRTSYAYRCLDGTDIYHIFYNHLEIMISHTKKDRWYGDYVNSDGGHDLNAANAKLAAEACGCLDIPLHEAEIVDFCVYNPNPDISRYI